MGNEALALRLGMKADEILDVYDSPAGQVIVTKGPVTMIDVPADQPDAEGKTGLMLFAAPIEREGSPVYTYPIFAFGPDTGPELDDDPMPEKVGELINWVAGDHERATVALAAENAREKPRATAVSQLEAVLASEPTDAPDDASGADEGDQGERGENA